MKKILCPVDFSSNSIEAARLAIRVASATDAEIKFCYVSSLVVPTGSIVDLEIPVHQLEVKKEELASRIHSLYDELDIAPGAKVYYDSFEDISIAGGIAEETLRFSADLIVMGSTGSSGLKRLLLGSVTSSVLDEVECPILVVPEAFGARTIRKIAMPTDVVHVEEDVLDAVEFAQLFGAGLDLFHVSVRQPNAEKLEDKLRFLTGYADISYTEIHPDYEGNVSGGLKQYVEAFDPDILIMHHSQKSWWDKLLSGGSYTKEMILNARSAILVLKRKK